MPDAAPENVTYLPLAEPFTAPGGLVVEFPGSYQELIELGLHFNNALSSPGFARRYARGEAGVYKVSLDGIPMSCGEIRPNEDGTVGVVWDRAHQNRDGTPATRQAVEAFAAAANAGEIELNYQVVDGEFEPKAAAPAP